MEKVDKAIEILTAFKNGKVIEYEERHGWERFTGSAWSLLQCISNNKIFRVKPQPTYRPYANAEEFIKDAVEHGNYLKDKNGRYLLVHISTFYGIDISYSNGISHFNYSDVLIAFTWADDNTPCGILE